MVRMDRELSVCSVVGMVSEEKEKVKLQGYLDALAGGACFQFQWPLGVLEQNLGDAV